MNPIGMQPRLPPRPALGRYGWGRSTPIALSDNRGPLLIEPSPGQGHDRAGSLIAGDAPVRAAGAVAFERVPPDWRGKMHPRTRVSRVHFSPPIRKPLNSPSVLYISISKSIYYRLGTFMDLIYVRSSASYWRVAQTRISRGITALPAGWTIVSCSRRAFEVGRSSCLGPRLRIVRNQEAGCVLSATSGTSPRPPDEPAT